MDQKGVQGDPRKGHSDPRQRPRGDHVRGAPGPGVPGRGKEFLPETPGSK